MFPSIGKRIIYPPIFPSMDSARILRLWKGANDPWNEHLLAYRPDPAYNRYSNFQMVKGNNGSVNVPEHIRDTWWLLHNHPPLSISVASIMGFGAGGTPQATSWENRVLLHSPQDVRLMAKRNIPLNEIIISNHRRVNSLQIPEPLYANRLADLLFERKPKTSNAVLDLFSQVNQEGGDVRFHSIPYEEHPLLSKWITLLKDLI